MTTDVATDKYHDPSTTKWHKPLNDKYHMNPDDLILLFIICFKLLLLLLLFWGDTLFLVIDCHYQQNCRIDPVILHY